MSFGLKGDPRKLSTHNSELNSLFDLLVRRVFSAKATIFVPLEAVRIVFLILHGGIISLFADRTGHRDNIPHLLPLSLGRDRAIVCRAGWVNSYCARRTSTF